MTAIKKLFDSQKDIYRPIEKVITYGANQEEKLKKEITEYIATESIEEQLERLITNMQSAMDAGGENEVGVWVSGFYGSGKSSFTKYLGLALDDSVTIDGIPFLKYLQDRLHKPQTKAILSTLAKSYPTAVVLLDLASEQVAGATMTEISTVLYYKVLQWAGFSRNQKVAALERRLSIDNRFGELEELFKKETGQEWKEYHNDELVVDSLLPKMAHALYPDLFPTDHSFTTKTSDFIYLQTDRMKEIVDIVRDHTGKENILFIIDEVGQYIGGQQHKILDLQGIAENIKRIGNGKVWIIGTAQQTLTEDNQRAALNSPELFKLKDRFPIQIDLESKDIKEICYRRLLAKSTAGEKALGELFDKHGQALRHNTKLEDAKSYDHDFTKETFINLYPFLPAHFDILLFLLGALAKSTGGFGLRSAIKVVQDILIEPSEGGKPVADRSLGWVATTVTLYDALEKDIQRAAQSIHQAVGKALFRFSESEIHKNVAKTVAVLQILDNIPITINNVASLMHGSVEVSSGLESVKKTIDEMINDPIVPFGEQDGRLRFFSEKLNDIEQERGQIALRSVDVKRIFNESLKEALSPLPSTKIHRSLSVTSGLKIQTGSMAVTLDGDRNHIQTIIEFVEPDDYDNARTRIVDESRHNTSKNTIFLVGKRSKDFDDLVNEIYRCNEICQRYRNEPDQEVKEYCASQADRAATLSSQLQHLMKTLLVKGSFIFRGQTNAVENYDSDIIEASKNNLSVVAEQVFDRYDEAPVRADTSVAEKLLRAGNLSGISSDVDPLSLVHTSGGTPQINREHKALSSIKDYIERNGTVEGKRILEHFSNPPFGWSQDTTRYCIAALLLAGEIKLRISGREVTGPGDQAIGALKTNNVFKNIGVSLRDSKPPVEMCAKAAERLTEIIGDTVVPLEQEISKHAMKQLPQEQVMCASLDGQLSALELPGRERIKSLNQEIADMVSVDASDAPQRLGAEDSSLYRNILWARNVKKAFMNNLDVTIRELRLHIKEIKNLPDTGEPGKLKIEVAEELQLIKERLSSEEFFKHDTELNSILTTMKARTRDTIHSLAQLLKTTIHDAEADIHRLPEWNELTREEQSDLLGQLNEHLFEVKEDIDGLKQLMNQQYVFNQLIGDLKQKIEHQGRERRARRLEEERKENTKKGQQRIVRSITFPQKIESIEELSMLIDKLNSLRSEMQLLNDIEINIEVGEKN